MNNLLQIRDKIKRANRLQPLGIDAFWLIKWHTGNFGIINLQPFYSIFLGIASIISIISGVKLLQKKS